MIFGGQVTNNFALSLVLTGLFFAAAGLAAVIAALRWRSLAAPVLATFFVTSGAIGGYLSFSTFNDRVVNEAVVIAAPAGEAPAGGPAEVASGEFTSLAHGTNGTAAVIRLEDGSHVLTLTDLDTDPGPDLRVYLVPGRGDDIGGFLDLGGLKGNRGTQQYAVPPDVDPARFQSVLIWCRAFSVGFGRAVLEA